MNDSEWFYLEAGQQQGPVTLETLVGLLKALPAGTLVWRDGLVDWLKAEDVPEVKALLAAPSPRPASTAARASGLGMPPPLGEAPSAPAAAEAPRPGYRAPSSLRPGASAPGSPAPRPDDEPETLNPLVLLGRCFRWGGRFSRAEFAVIYFSGLVVGLGLILGMTLFSSLTGTDESETFRAIAGLGVMALVVGMNVIWVGAAVRRLHDLGQPGLFALGLFLPCLNLLFVLYLLIAPGKVEGSAPAL